MKQTTREDNRPSFQFYPGDWLSATDLMSCSLESQGLWIMMLCMMWTSPKRGALLNSIGNQTSIKNLAKLTGENEKKIQKCIDELVESGTASILENGTLICRKMYRTTALRDIRREAVSQRKYRPISQSKTLLNTNQNGFDCNQTAEDEVEDEDEVVKEIIEDLNTKAGTNYKDSSNKTKELIKRILKQGFTVKDFEIVHTKKCSDWLSNPDMVKFLRPETLYGNKFEGYLNQPVLGNGKQQTKLDPRYTCQMCGKDPVGCQCSGKFISQEQAMIEAPEERKQIEGAKK